MNLIKSTGTFSFFTTISRILGYLRDILIAIFFGSGPLADAFFVAFRIPNTFRRLFSEGAFNAAFVPSYSSLLNKKKQEFIEAHHKRQIQDLPEGEIVEFKIEDFSVLCSNCHRMVHRKNPPYSIEEVKKKLKK